MSYKIKPMSFRPLLYNFHNVESTSIDGVYTLTNVVIANPTQIDFMGCLFFYGVATIIVA
jgi:hypothetical protein